MICLIGGIQQNRDPADHSLIVEMFARLPKDMVSGGNIAAGKLTRFIGFGGACESQEQVRFFGMEVDEVKFIPPGLLAWELDDTSLTVRQSDKGTPCPAWWEDINWLWYAGSQKPVGQPIGEFNAQGMPGWRPDGHTDRMSFRVFAHVPYDLGKDTFDDDVILVEYDPAWPAEYRRMAAWLKDRLGEDIALKIAHYGSTAIPGMVAKPVIDILVEIPSFVAGKERALSALDDPTWEFWCYADHMVFFKRERVMGVRTHHIHLAPAGHDMWKGLRFRDYLRQHPGDAARYADLKRELADKYRGQRETYTDSKGPFVESILEKLDP